jgi:hypothetical protein
MEGAMWCSRVAAADVEEEENRHAVGSREEGRCSLRMVIHHYIFVLLDATSGTGLGRMSASDETPAAPADDPALERMSASDEMPAAPADDPALERMSASDEMSAAPADDPALGRVSASDEMPAAPADDPALGRVSASDEMPAAFTDDPALGRVSASDELPTLERTIDTSTVVRTARRAMRALLPALR